MTGRKIAELAVSLGRGLPALPPLLIFLSTIACLLCASAANATLLESSMNFNTNSPQATVSTGSLPYLETLGSVSLKRVRRDLVHDPKDLGYYAPCTDTSTFTKTVTQVTDVSDVTTSVETLTLMSTSHVSLVSIVTLTENALETTVENSQDVFVLTENVTETHFLQVPSVTSPSDYKTVTSTSFKWVKLTHTETHVVSSTQINVNVESVTEKIIPNKELHRETETVSLTVTSVDQLATSVSTVTENESKLFIYKTVVPSMKVTYTETLLTPSYSVSLIVKNQTVTSYEASKLYETVTKTLWATSTSTIMEYQTKTTTATTQTFVDITTTSTSVVREKLTITASSTSTEFLTVPGSVLTVVETIPTTTYTKTVRKACHHR